MTAPRARARPRARERARAQPREKDVKWDALVTSPELSVHGSKETTPRDGPGVFVSFHRPASPLHLAANEVWPKTIQHHLRPSSASAASLIQAEVFIKQLRGPVP